MWVNILLFLATLLIAVYWLVTRNYGWFKARGVHEHEGAFPMGCAESNQAVTGKIHVIRYSNLIYNK